MLNYINCLIKIIGSISSLLSAKRCYFCMKGHLMKTPTLILQSKIAQQNIHKRSPLPEKQMDFRPHFKTHQSAEIGEWFKAEGIEKCSVSSLAMAQYFANAGWKDICVAIPFNINEIEGPNHWLLR